VNSLKRRQLYVRDPKVFIGQVKESNKGISLTVFEESYHHFMANRGRSNGNSERLYLGGAPKSLQMVTAAMELKDTCSLKEKLCPT